MRYRTLAAIIIIVASLAIVPLYVGAKTKTVTGTVTSVVSGNGSVGTVVKISLGSTSGLAEGSTGWVTEGDEVIAYISIVSVDGDSAVAVVAAHENVNKVTSGLAVNFNVKVKEGPGTTLAPAGKPGAYVPMFRGNPAHTGAYTAVGPAAAAALLWKFATGDYVRSTPAVTNGAVYVGSIDHNVYAIDAATGREKWRFTTGGRVFSSPAVADGVVYVGSDDDNVYALDAATGKEKWRFATGWSVYSSPAVVGVVVYFGSADGYVYALH